MCVRVRVSRERFQSTGTAKSQVFNNLVVAFYAQEGVDTEDPTSLKRFVTTFPAELGGGRVRVYLQQISSKLAALTVEHYSNLIVTSTLGIRQLTIS